jgi:putative intracellular protease/amidase
MPNAVIITGPGFQDHDVVYAYYRLLEEGWNVDIATKNGADVTEVRHTAADGQDRPAADFLRPAGRRPL